MNSRYADSDGKRQAHQLALDWWLSDYAVPERQKGYAVCDGCSVGIPPSEGYLCNPATLIPGMPPSPDLVCESCFDRHPRQPWNPAQVEQMAADLQALEQHIRRPSKQPAFLQQVSDSKIAEWFLNPYGDNRYNWAAFMAIGFALLTGLIYLFVVRSLGALLQPQPFLLEWWITYGLFYASAVIALVLGAIGFLSDRRVWALLGIVLLLIAILLAVLM